MAKQKGKEENNHIPKFWVDYLTYPQYFAAQYAKDEEEAAILFCCKYSFHCGKIFKVRVNHKYNFSIKCIKDKTWNSINGFMPENYKECFQIIAKGRYVG